MSSELDELRKMIDQQFSNQPNPADIPLHGAGVVPTMGATTDPNAVRITVSGEAQNATAGAVVIDAAGTQITTDLALWPDDVVGTQVHVSGTVTPSTQGQGLLQASWTPAS